MLFTGVLKLATTNEQFKTLGSGRLDWVDSLSSTQMKIIGVVEALIGFGLMLPQILNFWAWLTPLAAVGAVCTMMMPLMEEKMALKPSQLIFSLLL